MLCDNTHSVGSLIQGLIKTNTYTQVTYKIFYLMILIYLKYKTPSKSPVRTISPQKSEHEHLSYIYLVPYMFPEYSAHSMNAPASMSFFMDSLVVKWYSIGTMWIHIHVQVQP